MNAHDRIDFPSLGVCGGRYARSDAVGGILQIVQPLAGCQVAFQRDPVGVDRKAKLIDTRDGRRLRRQRQCSEYAQQQSSRENDG